MPGHGMERWEFYLSLHATACPAPEPVSGCIVETKATYGRFTVHRHTIAKRMRAMLLAIRLKQRKRMPQPLGETARWLRRVVQGCLNYHAMLSKSHRIGRLVGEVTRHWLRVIRRRSQRGTGRWTWAEVTD